VDQATLMGLTMMLVLGPAVGNYACSVIYRLPRGKTPFEQHPFCGHCNAALQTIDLYPIASWLMTRGKCRYCKGKIPSIYLAVELACLVIFMGYFLHFGISEAFLLYTSAAVFVVILAAIELQHGWTSSSIYGYALTFIALARTLAEGTIYGWIQTGFVMLVIVLAGMRIVGNKADPFSKPWVWWLTLLGALTPFAQWHWIAGVYALKLCIPKKFRVLMYASAALVLPIILY
jgi:prepilin signal peptidase PulO-like enzyme (type II secretory pathway)